MRNLFLERKIKKELAEFQKFKANYKFEMKELVENPDGSVQFDGVTVRETKDARWIGDTDNFVNVGYKLHGALPKVLSNLFPYEFYFKGYHLHSIESVFHSFMFKDRKSQKYLFMMHGLDSNNVKACSSYNWKATGVMYFNGKAMKRDSEEFDNFIDELYISALQNPLYRNALLNVGPKYILHSIGGKSKRDTAFTRFEFERELNCLKDFVQMKKQNEQNGKNK